ncbi:MAG: sugar ABC transporter ATP-binding protein [Planctomycetota bacterium]|jgi:ribose transport system ATP-binding protein
MPDTHPPLLQARSITKRFPGVLALHEVHMSVEPGEVLAVIGENGAGKSTLMKIIAGVQEPTEGRLLVDGNLVRIDSVETAMDLGIALIHQELNLADNLDVAANVFLGREPHNALGVIDKKKTYAETQQHLDMVGLDCAPTTLVRDLPIGQQQLIEIAKALSTNARLIIFDEPTSSLSMRETVQLFSVIKSLRDRDVSVMYISHRLGEVIELADRVTVLRDGENAGELAREEISHDAMVKLMVGRDVSQFYARQPHTPGDPVLQVKGLKTQANPFCEIDFEIRAGEIVGIAGLVGAGRSEVLQAVFGVDQPLGGEVRINGQPIDTSSSTHAIQSGVALVPENRKEHGLVVEMNVRENISLAGLFRHNSAGILDKTHELKTSTQMIEALSVKTPSDQQITKYLSGGNQQKVVLGKWLSLQPKVLLLDEPTRGIDIGAKEEIYKLMDRLAGQGVAICFVSSEMEEVLGMSDRTLVMHEGRITGELSREELSEEAVMQLATGQSHTQAQPA